MSDEPLLSWQKGMIARAKVEIRAIEKGVTVCIPTNVDARYDLVVDWCGKLYRAQVKYAGRSPQKVQGVAVVELRKGDRGERRYTSDEIDSLMVYVAPVDQVCWFEPEIFHDKTAIYVRYLPTKNNQACRCILLNDHIW